MTARGRDLPTLAPRGRGSILPAVATGATYRLEIAYDGGAFRGWARQPGQRTVEGEIGAALERLFGPTRLTVAGRTDAGVHALGQVASFTADGPPPRDLGRALNALTPPDIAIRSAEVAPDGFDARRDARSRLYRYRLLTSPVRDPFERGRSLHWPWRLDLGAVEACTESLLGSHDFTAFTPTDTKHTHFERRILAAGWSRPEPDPGILVFEIEADAFLRGMVRAIVGTMLEIGAGKRDRDDFERLLGGRPREEAGDTARPHGLYLSGVRY
jgi:tRNA pseudouridine38-40 synthase